MTFKRMMLLGAMASALAFTGCQDRSRTGQDVGTGGAGDQSQQVPATGGSGRTDTIPENPDTMGGTQQGSGSLNNDNSGAPVDDMGSSRSLDQSGTGGSSLPDDQTDDTRKDDQNINR
jgi:hypothetical protein